MPVTIPANLRYNPGGCHCCDCVVPKVFTRRIRADGNKCGWIPNDVGSSWRHFKTVTIAGDFAYADGGDCGSCGSDCTHVAFSGALSYTVGIIPDLVPLADGEPGSAECSADDTREAHWVDNPLCEGAAGYPDGRGYYDPLPCGASIAPAFSSGGLVTTYAADCRTGSGTVTLTDEVSFTDLLDYVYARFAYVPWSDWTGSYFDSGSLLAQFFRFGEVAPDNSDMEGMSLDQGQYQFKFTVPASSRCYKVEWDVIYEPFDGDPVLIEHKTFTWDGEIPDGYDPDDDSTWPVSDVYDIPNTTFADQGFIAGNVMLRNLVVVCDDCGE